MAREFTCDGCRTPMAELEVDRVGHAQKGEYCKTCAEIVRGLYDKYDVLHEQVQKVWNKGLTDLLVQFVVDHPDFDVPDFRNTK